MQYVFVALGIAAVLLGLCPERASALPGQVRYDYDALGRVCRVQHNDGSIIAYLYDANGNRTQIDTVSGPGGATNSTACPDGSLLTNSAPIAVVDDFILGTGALPVLANDIDPDGDPLVVTMASGTGISLEGGKVMFVSPGRGSYMFLYSISDGRGGVATGSGVVHAPNAPPVAVTDFYAMQPNASAILDVLSNDTDPEGDSLSLLSQSSGSGSIVANKIDYVSPSPSGLHTFTYEVSDGEGGVAQGSVNVTVANVAPVAVNDNYSQAYSTTQTYNVLANDSDANGDALTLTAEDSPYASIVGNQLQFAAPAVSGLYFVTYTVSDGMGGTASATATFSVANAPPVAVNDSYTQTHSTTVDHNVLSNDTDANGDTLTLTSVSGAYASVAGNKLRFAAPAASGTYTVTYTVSDGKGGTANGTVTITVPNVAPVAVNDSYTQTHSTTVDHNVLSNDTDANGDALTLTAENSPYASIVSNKLRFVAPAASGAYTVTYTVSDGKGGTANGTVTITVPNVAPQLTNDSFNVAPGTIQFLDVLANDSDPNGDSLTITGISWAFVLIEGNKLRFAAPGPATTYNLTYTVSDGKGGSATASVTVTVPNVAPVAVNDSYTQTHSTLVDRAVLANDTDANGDTLSLTSVSGAYTTKVNNNLRFAAPAASGVYTSTYTISDGNGGSASATVTTTVPNVAPVGVNDSFTQAQSTTADWDVLANDTDANGDALTLTSVSGSYASIVSNKLRFAAPATGGSYTVSYTLSDGKGGTSSATASIFVQAVLARNSAGQPIAPYYNTYTPILGPGGGEFVTLMRPEGDYIVHVWRTPAQGCTAMQPRAGYYFTGNGCEIAKQ